MGECEIPLLREELLNLEAKGPRAAFVRLDDIVEGLNVGIHRLAANVQDLAASPTYRHRPLISRGRFPIRGHHRGACKIPAVRKIGVHKGLHQEPVNTLSIISTASRCLVGEQNTDQPWALNGKECGRESCAVLAGTQAAHISETRRQCRLIDQRDNGTRNQIPVRGRWDFVPASRFQANLPRWQTRQDRVVLGHTTW